MGGAAARAGTPSLLSIGQVLALLQENFADLTPSKLRFLEEQGLVTPERTKSGYRKFSQVHIERIRMILTLQRDHFLPLKVIAEVLEEVDAGRDPIIPGAVERSASSILTPSRVLSGEELCRNVGTTSRFLGQAIAAGMMPAADVFPFESIAQLSALVRLAEVGVSPQHLRSVRLAAEKDAELLGRALSTRGAKPGTPQRAESATQLVEHLEVVRSGVLRRALESP